MHFILLTLQICLLFVMILVLAFDIVKMVEKCIDRRIEERMKEFDRKLEDRLNDFEGRYLMQQWDGK